MENMNRVETVEPVEPLLLRIEEVARMLSVSKSKAYLMAVNNEIPGVVRFGRSVRVTAESLRMWVKAQANAEAPNAKG